MQKTVELSREEKHKLMNQKLNMLLARKKKQEQPKPVQQKPVQMVVQQQKPLHNESQNLKHQQQIPNKKQQQEAPKDNTSQFPRTKRIKKPQKKQKRILRKAAGDVWEDKTLEDWNPNDFRIFCGNLGNEVHDELLGNTFRRYDSFQKAKVIRDKRTGKSKGYGFVAFSNPKDFLKSLKEMNNKYIGSRPVKLIRSNWKERNIDSTKNSEMPSDFKNFKKVQEPVKNETK